MTNDFPIKNLITLPLFYGIGASEMQKFVTSIPHTFKHYQKGNIIAKRDDMCNTLIVAVHGTVSVVTFGVGVRFSVCEKLLAPMALSPESLYGITTRYCHTFIAHTDVDTLEIPKEGVAGMFSEFEVFRLNLINYLSTKIYRRQFWLWRDLSGSVEQRIVDFIHAHCLHPANEKQINISMDVLGSQINETRRNVATALNNLKKRGFIQTHRRLIIVPELEKLIAIGRDTSSNSQRKIKITTKKI